MKRITYWDFGKWRIRIGDTEYSGKDVDRIAAIEDILGDEYDLDELSKAMAALRMEQDEKVGGSE